MRVHPVVLFGVMDHYSRRAELKDRVVGALLGSVSIEGVVEVRNYFPVPHTDKEDQIVLDIEHFNTMLELYLQTNSREVIVGWYGTGKDVSFNDFYLNDFFSNHCSSPVFLVIDASLAGTSIDIRAFVAKQLGFGGSPWGQAFNRIPCELKASEGERVTLDFIMKSTIQAGRRMPSAAPLLSEVNAVKLSIKKVVSLLDDSLEAVQSVMSGERRADPRLGRALSEAVGVIPALTEEEFRRMFDGAVEDVLMVAYLASLTRAQLVLGQKLNTMSAQ